MSDQPAVPQVPQSVCPACFSSVPYGVPYCPQCGNAMPGAYPPVVPPYTTPPSPRKSRVGLMIGIVLVAVIVIGLGGYFAFQNSQQILQAAKDSDQTAANQGINQLQITCFTARTDNSTLHYYYGTGFSGYETSYETFG